MQEKKVKGTTLDLLICTAIYIVLVAFLMQLLKMPKDVRLYPTIIMVGAFTFNTILLVQTIIKTTKNTSDCIVDGVEIGFFKSTAVKIITYILIIAGYIFLIPKIGYILSTFIFLLGMMLYIGVRNIKLLIVLPIVMTLAIYYLFTYVLVVILPKGTWISIAL